MVGLDTCRDTRNSSYFLETEQLRTLYLPLQMWNSKPADGEWRNGMCRLGNDTYVPCAKWGKHAEISGVIMNLFRVEGFRRCLIFVVLDHHADLARTRR